MSLTQEEKKLLNKTAEVWNEWQKLPVIHPCDQREFEFYLHSLQNIILSRSGYREVTNTEQ